VPSHAGHVRPLAEQLVGISELADNLFRCVLSMWGKNDCDCTDLRWVVGGGTYEPLIETEYRG
jgi:hypothetical protein